MKLLLTSNFSFSQSVFKRLVLQIPGKGYRNFRKAWTGALADVIKYV